MKPNFVGFFGFQQAEGIRFKPPLGNATLSVQTRHGADRIRQEDEFVPLPTNLLSFDEAQLLKELHALAPSPNGSRARVACGISVIGFVSDFNDAAVHVARK
jgi:hypothetical protein